MQFKRRLDSSVPGWPSSHPRSACGSDSESGGGETVTVPRPVTGVYLDAPGDPGTSFAPAELHAKWLRLLTPALGESAATAVLASLADPEAGLHRAFPAVWERK